MSHGAADDTAVLGQRKLDHIDLCATQDVESRSRTTLLEQVFLLHDSLPELAVADIDLRTQFLGRTLPTPLMISGMTGGVDRAGEINRVLARVAQDHGLAFGVGSQRPMLRDPALTRTYAVRDVAPDVFLCGNIGVIQAAATPTDDIRRLVEDIDANALCVHLNPGQEIVQDHGDRDFRGGLDAIARLVRDLPIPVIAKETGCGLSPRTLQRLREVGVAAVDVSGAGGTTWVGVEALRGQGTLRSVGDALWDWGVPTAASILWAQRAGMQPIASGGLRDGHDAARALSLGARLASAALPFLRAAHTGGYDAASDVAKTWLETVRAVMLLTGSGNLEALRTAPRLLGPDLQRWNEAVRV